MYGLQARRVSGTSGICALRGTGRSGIGQPVVQGLVDFPVLRLMQIYARYFQSVQVSSEMAPQRARWQGAVGFLRT